MSTYERLGDWVSDPEEAAIKWSDFDALLALAEQCNAHSKELPPEVRAALARVMED